MPFVHFSDITEEGAESTTSTLRPDESGSIASNMSDGVAEQSGEKPSLEMQQSKTDDKPVTYHADFEMPIFNVQVHSWKRYYALCILILLTHNICSIEHV